MKTKTNELIKCACGCGETIEKFDSRGRPRIYAYNHYSRVQPSKRIIIKCENCGNDFYIHKYRESNVNHHFCNQKCAGEWATKNGTKRGKNNGHYNTIITRCSGCGEEIQKAASLVNRRNNRVYCKSCVPVKLRNGRSGFYVGYPKEFSPSLRAKIRKRDGFICAVCKRSSGLVGTLHVHHIDYDKNHNNPDNLISLCVKCHGETNFGKEKWIEFFHSLSVSP